MVRGINKGNILEDDEERTRFPERLGENVVDEITKGWTDAMDRR